MLYGYFFVLKINGHELTLRGDGYQSRDRANRMFAIALNDCGYRPPRFWQVWRWKEDKPSPDVLKLMRRERNWA